MNREFPSLADRSPNYMGGLFMPDPLVTGVKGLVYIGDDIILCRRDYNTNDHPGCLDLLGGGVEPGESPFETFRREVWEEAGLEVRWQDIVHAKRYDGPLEGRFSYFPVARVYARTANPRLGNEGLELVAMSLDEYLARTDAWPFFQERASEFADLLPFTLRSQRGVGARYGVVGRQALLAA